MSAGAAVVGLLLATLVGFGSARRGSEHWKVRDESSRRARWEARVTSWLRSTRTGAPLVLAGRGARFAAIVVPVSHLVG